MNVIINSGYFDPIHVGHIEYFRLSKNMGDKLIVIVNNDKQALLKKGYSFMSENDRMKIVESVRYVDEVVLSIDDDRSVSRTLRLIRGMYEGEELIFANGGDRFTYEIPETGMCKDLHIQIVDGVGKKIGNSSEFINRVKSFGVNAIGRSEWVEKIAMGCEFAKSAEGGAYCYEDGTRDYCSFDKCPKIKMRRNI